MRVSQPTISWLCAGLAALTLLVFSRAATCDFVSYDDDVYVTKNEMVKQGLTLNGVRYALTQSVGYTWHPVTTISHMLDCQMFGLASGPHHLVSVVFHAANGVLLFLLLWQTTNSRWLSFIVAALFALHPLRVESVAWVSERKDVLSAFFGLLCLLGYVRYVREKDSGRPAEKWYWLAFAAFVLGILSKPMLVTWPFVMLLLDLWPLRRFSLGLATVQGGGEARPSLPLGRLVVEKIPYFIVSALICKVTAFTQFSHGAGTNLSVSFSERLQNVGVAYMRYLHKTVWPTDLAILYPHPGHWPLALVLISFGVLAVLTLLGVLFRRHLWSVVSWFWFLGTLVPVIGLVQVGPQSMADRYSYIPHIGLLCGVVWLLAGICRQFKICNSVIVAGAVLVVSACAILTWNQIGHWRNSEALFARDLAVTKENYLGHYNYAVAIAGTDRASEMAYHYTEAIRIKPDYYPAQINLGLHLYTVGDFAGATNHLGYGVSLHTNYPLANYYLAKSQIEMGDFTNAEQNFVRAAERLNQVPVQSDWAKALIRQRRYEEAIPHFENALLLETPDVQLYSGLGEALDSTGRATDAASRYRQALEITPDAVDLQNRLAWLLATSPDDRVRDGKEAIRLAARASASAAGTNAEVLGTLAAAYAEDGKFEDAQRIARDAIKAGEATGQSELIRRQSEQLKLYGSNKPFRQSRP